ncbi:hypothetical protein ASU31_08750 [Pedobacter ginsenosidimutans]|uniref:DUF3823 domain-containing protein n=1 Tax=Pedobacter ginsenosidimutans TaxID=687842 RepID=A0A0T5VQZ5_9SPHI|nr:DUF3823 domain-containing protein [Pedobacter ginsenosidimutans]KRT16256.1 hypothetical protein ASU31_08750 [Pedobacter ginsenosidimutans]
MKIKFLTIFIAATSLFLASCGEYDNFDAPEFTLSGKVVYQNKPLGVRNNGPRFELWQDGYALRSPIYVYMNQDGSFSAKLFAGQYKLTRMADAPWLQQATDTIRVNVTGDTNLDVPVTPYFNITNETFAKSGNTISANFVVNKVVQTANVELVRLYLGKSILTDQVLRDVRVDGNVSSLVFGSPTTLSADIPDNLKTLDFIYARVGVKATVAGEYVYSQVQKIALK